MRHLSEEEYKGCKSVAVIRELIILTYDHLQCHADEIIGKRREDKMDLH
jgi:hypothetical protein